jgi:hypothetical protein
MQKPQTMPQTTDSLAWLALARLLSGNRAAPQ